MALNNIQAISKDVVFGDDGTSLTIGSLPANAIITAIKVLVSVAFDSSGTDLVIVGISTDTNKFADAVDVSSTGSASVTQLNVGAVESASGSTDILVQYDQSVADAAAGALKVVVEFLQE